MITRDVLASQIRNYLQHRITHSALVDWAERAMMVPNLDRFLATRRMLSLIAWLS